MLPAILMLAGTAISAASQYKQGKDAEDYGLLQAAEVRRVADENAQLLMRDAGVIEESVFQALEQTAQRVRIHKQETDAFLATQKKRLAYSGVAVRGGTALDTINKSIKNAAIDRANIMNQGIKEARKQNLIADRYRYMSARTIRDAAMQADLIEQGAFDQATAGAITAGATAVRGLARYWTQR